MPTYEYVCRQCGEHLEVVQSFRDDALTVCPGCEGELRKVFSAAGIIFKGSGWHIKDYASDRGGATKSAQGGEDASSPSEAGSSSSDKGGADGEGTGSAATADTKGSGSNGSEPKGAGSKGSDAKSTGTKRTASTGGDSAASA